MTISTPDDGVAADATGPTRRRLLKGLLIGTGAAAVPTAAGSLLLGATAQGPGGGAAAAPAAGSILPQQAAIVDRFHADSLAAQADNTGVARWAGDKGVLALEQDVGGQRPRYRTNVANGKPAVQATGRSSHNMSFGATGARLLAALNGDAGAIGFVIHGLATSGDRYVIGTDVNTYPSIALCAGAEGVGRSSVERPNGLAGFQTLLFTRDKTGTNGAPSRGRIYINGLPTCQFDSFSNNNNAGPAGDVRLFAVLFGGSVAPHAGITLSDLVVWSGATLLAPDAVDFHRWACAKYAKALPWAGQTHVKVIAGDSIPMGEGTPGSSGGNLYYQLKARMGFSHGQAGIIAVPSIGIADMARQLNQELEPMAARIGLPYRVFLGEYANTRAQSLPADGPVAAMTALLRDRRTARAAGSKVILFDSTALASDENDGGVWGRARADYDRRVQALSSLYDNFQAVSGDPNIGAAGAFTSRMAYPSTYSDDGTHLTGAGRAILATFAQAGFAALGA